MTPRHSRHSRHSLPFEFTGKEAADAARVVTPSLRTRKRKFSILSSSPLPLPSQLTPVSAIPVASAAAPAPDLGAAARRPRLVPLRLRLRLKRARSRAASAAATAATGAAVVPRDEPCVARDERLARYGAGREVAAQQRAARAHKRLRREGDGAVVVTSVGASGLVERGAVQGDGVVRGDGAVRDDVAVHGREMVVVMGGEVDEGEGKTLCCTVEGLEGVATGVVSSKGDPLNRCEGRDEGKDEDEDENEDEDGDGDGDEGGGEGGVKGGGAVFGNVLDDSGNGMLEGDDERLDASMEPVLDERQESVPEKPQSPESDAGKAQTTPLLMQVDKCTPTLDGPDKAAKEADAAIAKTSAILTASDTPEQHQSAPVFHPNDITHEASAEEVLVQSSASNTVGDNILSLLGPMSGAVAVGPREADRGARGSPKVQSDAEPRALADIIPEEPIAPCFEAPQTNGSPVPQKERGTDIEVAKPKIPAFSKRVRFSEPKKDFPTVKNKVGVLSVMKWKRRHDGRRVALSTSAQDLAVRPSSVTGPDEKGRQVLLDELQYLLDGIFKTAGSGGNTADGKKNHLITTSLRTLIKLFLRKAKRSALDESRTPGDDCGILLDILARQPTLLKKILNRLLSILGRSRAVDMLLSLAFLVIFRCTSQVLLVGENDLDILLNGFFRNSASSLKEDESQAHASATGRGSNAKSSSTKRRGRLGRRHDDGGQAKDELFHVNGLVREAGIMNDCFEGFKTETDASSYLMGVSIGLLMEGQEATRVWMRDNRRLDRVVAVLYSCEKVLVSRHASMESSDGEKVLSFPDLHENRTTTIVMGASMSILEFATLDPVCQLRVAEESRVCLVVLGVIRNIVDTKGGISAAESILCSALRLCMNLTHHCSRGLERFLSADGTQTVVDCLAEECKNAGMVGGNKPPELARNFDVRALCLALLASIAHESEAMRKGFREVRPKGVAERDGGAIALVLELLKNAGKEPTEGTGSEELADKGRVEARVPLKGVSCNAEMMEDPASVGMEQKVTVGYLCLLVGVLVGGCTDNREFVRASMPGQSLLSVAAVLDEFMDFHHEVGVISGPMNEMFKVVIGSLIESEQAWELLTAGPEIAALEGEGGERNATAGTYGPKAKADAAVAT